MIDAQITLDMRLYQDLMELSLAIMSHCKSLLDGHLKSTRETLVCLRRGGGANWPRTPNESRNSTILDLILDYKALVDQTELLKQRCIQGSGFITTGALLQESKRVAEQNDDINRITKLAFFFVPTSFVASFFGMNSKQFGQGELHLWIGVVVMVLVVVAAVACYSDEASRRWKHIAGNLGDKSAL